MFLSNPGPWIRVCKMNLKELTIVWCNVTKKQPYVFYYAAVGSTLQKHFSA